MYQCQMGKQTMGTPAHAMKHRSDNKLYRIQNPQVGLFLSCHFLSCHFLSCLYLSCLYLSFLV